MLFAHTGPVPVLVHPRPFLDAPALCNLFVMIETFKTPHVPETELPFRQLNRGCTLRGGQLFFDTIEAASKLLRKYANVRLLDDVKMIARDPNLF